MHHFRLIFIPIDLGMFPLKHCKFYIERQYHCRTFIKDVINTACRFPLSLKQMAKFAIRRNMRDVHVLADGYTLSIPKTLQVYVSVKSLNAQIHPWYLLKVEEHIEYNVFTEVCEKYTSVPPNLFANFNPLNGFVFLERSRWTSARSVCSCESSDNGSDMNYY